MNTPDPHLATVLSWVGRSHAHVDCEQLLVQAFRLRGVEIPGFYRALAQRMFRTVDTPEPWDVVPVNNHRLDIATHAGLYVGNGQVIHSFEDSGVVVLPLSREPWWSRISRYADDPTRRGYLRLRHPLITS